MTKNKTPTASDKSKNKNNRNNYGKIQKIIAQGQNEEIKENIVENPYKGCKNQKDIIKIHKNNEHLKIATINADNLRNKDSIERITDLIKRKNIDIACIQETHNERTDTFEEQNYTFFFGGNDCNAENNNTDDELNKKAGVAIIIKNTLVPYIKTIHKINGRIMEIRIKTDKSLKDLSILNTYAPHMGYSAEK